VLVEHPQLRLLIYPVNGPKVWPFFAPSHYMTAKYAGHRAWIVVTPEGDPVAFTSIIRFPHGNITFGWRGHRTVVLPDFQGLGIGGRLSDWTGEHVTRHMFDDDGNPGRYYSRTVHPRFGAYRNASDKWRATTSSEKVGSKPNAGISATALMRWSFSHEYVGSGGNASSRKGASRKPGGRKAPGGGGRGVAVPAAMPESSGNRVEVPELFHLQAKGVRFLELAGSALLADEMGGGKTAQAAMATHALPALILCPASVMDGWRKELARFRPDLRVQVAPSGTAKVVTALDAIRADAADVFILNYEAMPNVSRLAKYGSIALLGCEECDEFSDRPRAKCERQDGPINTLPWRTVIADEAHRLKDGGTKWTRATWATADKADNRYALTGTPIAENPDDLFVVMRFVAPEEYGSKGKLRDRYALTEANVWSGFDVSVGFDPRMRDEFDAFFLPRFLRRTKKQMVPGLKDKVFVERESPMSPKQRKAYTDMAKDMLAQLDSGILMAGDPLSKMTRLKQFAAAYAVMVGDKPQMTEPSGKADTLIEVLEEAGDLQLVVFAESTQLLDILSARMDKHGFLHTRIDGGVPKEQRPAKKELFLNGHAQHILISLGAGAEGLDELQYVSDTAVFAQRSFNEVLNVQAEDRLHRRGQEGTVTILDLITRGTVEERVHEVRYIKQEMLQDLVRDEETMRRWLGKS
jgi:SNF2 family DNA or RNA helicase